MRRNVFGLTVLTGILLAIGGVLLDPIEINAQTPRRTATPRPTPTPVPNVPEVISRAEDFPLDGARIIEPGPPIENGDSTRPSPSRTVEELEERIRQLENGLQKDPDAVQRRLMMNLDILTRAEQRSESLRKQLFEMIEKENSVRLRLDSISIDIRPELIERMIATAGSLRPEELREARRKQLEAEQASLQNLLTEIQRNKTNLEMNVQRADELVERLRVRVEREIDAALNDPVERPL